MTKSFRIALVTAFPPGQNSLNEYGLHLAKGLADRTDVSEVVIIADQLDADLPELDLGPKIRVERVWRFNRVSSALRILRALRRAAPDGVLWNLQTATFGDKELPAALGLLAPAAARVLGLSSGIIAHNLISGIDLENTQLKGQRIRQTLVRAGGAVVTRAMLSASYMTVTLRGYLEQLSQSYPKANVHLVPHGTFDTEVRPSRPLSERPRRIVTMGKFGTYKRLETLLTAFDTLRENPDFADFELVIGGQDHPSTPGYLADLAKERANDKAVIFHGYIAEEEIPDFFENARLSVFDYNATTGSSGVLHQTASYGAVPVFPRIGDFVDVCRDEGLSGAHYGVMNAAEMAEAMTRMLSDHDEAQAIADNNRLASQDMPFSEVVRFHVERLTQKPLKIPETKTVNA
ncbi:glycosyltransferase [Actibacterium lipolyticum]|uniref:Glycosyl transferases group 1 n=1 Tax=Actibacterium lipolyticum TaxID=1524263 RepID=A0A238JLN8_9RHOB|nr:glycosyltransferase [Actibacterium lipolyticum]SMX31104.1 Glycosyl transferases group 1 [Actibacterium lipolyticum]